MNKMIILMILSTCITLQAQVRDSVKIDKYLTIHESENVTIDDYTFADEDSGEGKYSGKFKDGEWKYYYKDKKLWKVGLFKKNLKEGQWKAYYRNGKLREVENYSNGRKNGVSLAYNEDGELVVKSFYKEDLIEGEFIHYYDGGNVYEKGSYLKNVKNGEWNTYYKGGSVQSVEWYEQGEKVGKHINYSNNGKVESEEIYKKGVTEYERKTYFENGKVLEEGHYIGFKRNGTIIRYHINGLIFMKMIFKEGRFLEMTEYKDINGNKLDVGTFKNGNGILNIYDEAGTLKSIVEFINGEKKKK